jgi:adenosine 3'-phospho 5'-phosphosulfate transporter B2
VGLQGSYLVWGVLQEQVMTRSYGTDADGNAVYFKNSQFLVLVNRLLALLVACVIIKCTKQPPHTAPFVKYSFSSMSNVLSSWCQYEALKYVSFPTQVRLCGGVQTRSIPGSTAHSGVVICKVLAKASKIVPVMIMGKFVEGERCFSLFFLINVRSLGR